MKKNIKLIFAFALVFTTNTLQPAASNENEDDYGDLFQQLDQNLEAALQQSLQEQLDQMYEAIIANDTEQIQALVRQGVGPETRLADGRTALELALVLEHEECVSALLGKTSQESCTEEKSAKITETIEKTAADKCRICIDHFEENERCITLYCNHDFHEHCMLNSAHFELKICDELIAAEGANYQEYARCPLCKQETEYSRTNKQLGGLLRNVVIASPSSSSSSSSSSSLSSSSSSLSSKSVRHRTEDTCIICTKSLSNSSQEIASCDDCTKTFHCACLEFAASMNWTCPGCQLQESPKHQRTN